MKNSKKDKREEGDHVRKDKAPNDINATPSTRPRTIKIGPITMSYSYNPNNTTY
jgi:hypothetical protein